MLLSHIPPEKRRGVRFRSLIWNELGVVLSGFHDNISKVMYDVNRNSSHETRIVENHRAEVILDSNGDPLYVPDLFIEW